MTVRFLGELEREDDCDELEEREFRSGRETRKDEREERVVRDGRTVRTARTRVDGEAVIEAREEARDVREEVREPLDAGESGEEVRVMRERCCSFSAPAVMLVTVAMLVEAVADVEGPRGLSGGGGSKGEETAEVEVVVD